MAREPKAVPSKIPSPGPRRTVATQVSSLLDPSLSFLSAPPASAVRLRPQAPGPGDGLELPSQES